MKRISIIHFCLIGVVVFSTCETGPDTNLNSQGIEPSEWYQFPTWSPIGKWIAYEHYAIDSLFGIWLVRPDGSNKVWLTDGISFFVKRRVHPR
ncbi:MAG: hypothetical protein H8E56_00120 [Candidatus Marinimicrobia bacterium]|nr:hypothetical protein [Candidatus Neomarinimicrobiota bacterium]